MEGIASVYQVNPVSRIAGERRAEFLRTWGPDFDQRGGGRGGEGGGDGWGSSICAWISIDLLNFVFLRDCPSLASQSSNLRNLSSFSLLSTYV